MGLKYIYFKTIKNYRKDEKIEWNVIYLEPIENKQPSWCPITLNILEYSLGYFKHLNF